MAAFVRDRFGVKDTTQATTVPSDPQSRLMYYMDCICSLVPGISVPQRLRDFKRVVLSHQEENLLLQLTQALGPSELSGKIIFQDNSMDRANRFMELQHDRNIVAATNSVVIGGQQKRVAKIMKYTSAWMNRNYYSARRELINKRNGPSHIVVTSSSCALL